MQEINTVMSWLEGLTQDDWADLHSDSEVQNIAKAALELLGERKAGYWIPTNGKLGNEKRCSECNYKVISEKIDWQFCPHCGAEMVNNEAKRVAKGVFQENLMRLAEEKEVTTREIARAIGVTEVRLWRLLHDARPPKPTEAMNLLLYFDCKPSELFGGTLLFNNPLAHDPRNTDY